MPETIDVPENIIAVEVRDAAVALLLSRHPEAIVVALDASGFRVPLPASVGVPDRQTLPVPVDRATLVNVVVPADGMKVISIWEQAARARIAMGTVRTRNRPDQPVTMTFIDMRHLHEVWLGIFTDPEATAAEPDASGRLARSLLVPLRPRTATVHKGIHAIITGVDDRATRMLGWAGQQMVGARSTEFIHPDDHERALTSWMEMLSRQENQRVRVRHLCRDGTWLWVEIENVYRHAEDHRDVVVVSEMTDISDEMATHDALDRREKLFRRLAESLPVGLLQLEPDGSPVYANARLAEILGVSSAGTLAETLAAQLATVVERDRAILDAALVQACEHGVDQELEIDIRRPGSQEIRQCAVTLVGLTDRDGLPGAIACVWDITDSARMREELKVKATFDALTGCHNRASVLATLDLALAVDDRPTGMIFVDLNRFKVVNDTLGHAAGDDLLVYAANALAGLLRGDDIVGRIGGDEFLLVCRGLDGPDEALAIAERVREALHQPVPLAAGVVDLGASIGIALSEPGIPGDTLIARADAAMYESKREGLGRPVLYSPAPLRDSA